MNNFKFYKLVLVGLGAGALAAALPNSPVLAADGGPFFQAARRALIGRAINNNQGSVSARRMVVDNKAVTRRPAVKPNNSGPGNNAKRRGTLTNTVTGRRAVISNNALDIKREDRQSDRRQDHRSNNTVTGRIFSSAAAANRRPN
ncbi:MAG: hypothetical protein Q7R92_05680 [bacterium]|nr:hypothetical protein [bacterium]